MRELEHSDAVDPERAEALALTVEDVTQRVTYIAAKGERGEEEEAHGAEDRLHRQVLRAVAAGHPDSQILAAAALHTNDLNFERWYA